MAGMQAVAESYSAFRRRPPHAGCRGGLSRSARRGVPLPTGGVRYSGGCADPATHAHSCPETSDQARRPPCCRQLAGCGAAVHRGSHVQDPPGRAHRRWHVPGGLGAEPGCPGRARRRSRPARERDGRGHLAPRASGRAGQFPVRGRDRGDRRIGTHVHPQGRHVVGTGRGTTPCRPARTLPGAAGVSAPRLAHGRRRVPAGHAPAETTLPAPGGVPARDLPALWSCLPRRHRRRLPRRGRGRVPGRLDRHRGAVQRPAGGLAGARQYPLSRAAGDRRRPRPVRPGRCRGSDPPDPGRPDAHARRVHRDGRSRGTGHAGVDRRDRRPWPDFVRALRGARRAAAAVVRLAAAGTRVPVPRAHVSGCLSVPLRCPARVARRCDRAGGVPA